jgi:hypothetical protein
MGLAAILQDQAKQGIAVATQPERGRLTAPAIGRYAMGRSSQQKGRRSELALSRLLSEIGHEVRPHTQWEPLDLTVDDKPVEVKCRANGFTMFYTALDAGAETIYVKADRKLWIKMDMSYVLPPLKEDVG